MPTINLKERKRRRVKTRAIAHAQEIYSDPRWRSLRDFTLLHEPLCRRCNEEMKETKLAEEVHHIIPFSQGRNIQQVELLAFDPDNLEPLCIECHKCRHREMNK